MKAKSSRQSFKRRCALSLSIASLLFIVGLCNLGVVREAYGEWWESTVDMIAGQTPVRAQHFLELRNAIDNKRELCGLTPITWTDPSLIRGQTPIRAIHIEEIRGALLEIYNTPPNRAPSFTFTGTVGDFEGNVIKFAHFTEIRLAWEEMTFCGDGVCNGPEDGANCAGDCLCNYGPWVDGECGVGTCDAFEVQQIKIDVDNTPGCDDLDQCVIDYTACCNYGEWVNGECGPPFCVNNSDMAQTQTAELGCPVNNQCFPNHSLCCSYADEDSFLGCGLGDCEANEALWGKEASDPSRCPLDPGAECVLDVDVGVDCCQYQEWEEHDCGGGEGGDDEMYITSIADVVDPVFCKVQHDCELSKNCCDYSDPVPGECGGAVCSEGPNYVLDISTPAFPSALCEPLGNCRLDETYCCGGYSDPEAQTCGEWECRVTEMYYVSLPLDVASGCATRHTCVPDVAGCCGGYTIFFSPICGTDGCPPDSRYQVEVPGLSESGCPDLNATCVLDEGYCCGGYTLSVGDCGIGCTPDQKYEKWVPGTYVTGCVDRDGGCVAYSTECCGTYETTYGECGAASGCAANQRYQADIPSIPLSGCPDLNAICVLDEDHCCGYGLYIDQSCGETAACSSDEMYQISTPSNLECNIKTICDPRPAYCCTNGPFIANPDGCGLGDCDLGYRQWISEGSGDCADLFECHLDSSCNECISEATEPCEIDGCSGTKTCGTSGFYGLCIQNAPECPSIGFEQPCLNIQGISSYQFCDECFEWGECSCVYSTMRPCTTGGGCPGQRTCANNIWEDCQRIRICHPGAMDDCTTSGGLQGVFICSDCGDAWSTECLCMNGATAPCEGGVRACNSGVWSACVPN